MRIIVLTALVAVAGCATQPEEPDAQASGDAVASAAVVQPAAATPPAPAAEPAAAASANGAAAVAGEEEKPFVPPTGYKLRKDKGPDTYCTKVTVLGSRFPKEDCRTASQLRDLERQKEVMRREMDQRNAVCASAAGCANN
jgi:hypothetical protein